MEEKKNTEITGNEEKRITVKSAVPLWIAGGVWVIGAFFPLYKLPVLLLFGGISAAAGLIAKKVIKPEYRTVELPKEPEPTGDPEVDAAVREIDGVCSHIEELRRKICEDKREMANSMEKIVFTSQKIKADVKEHPEDLRMIRRYRSYYLPTIEKLCDKYVYAWSSASDGESVTETLTAIEAAMGQIEVTCDKVYDSLFADDALDVTTDIKVLEGMIRRDGLQ